MQVQTIIVQPDDNLSALALTYNTTMLRLYYANTQISDPNLIFPGEQLVVPPATEVLTPRALPSDAVVAQPEAVQTTVAATTATTTTTSSAPVAAPASASGSVWYEIARCESGGNWSIDTGNGFYGGLQFTLSSWRAVGGSGYPNQASASEQIALAEALQARQGWGAWPVCSAKLGL